MNDFGRGFVGFALFTIWWNGYPDASIFGVLSFFICVLLFVFFGGNND